VRSSAERIKSACGGGSGLGTAPACGGQESASGNTDSMAQRACTDMGALESCAWAHCAQAAVQPLLQEGAFPAGSKGYLISFPLPCVEGQPEPPLSDLQCGSSSPLAACIPIFRVTAILCLCLKGAAGSFGGGGGGGAAAPASRAPPCGSRQQGVSCQQHCASLQAAVSVKSSNGRPHLNTPDTCPAAAPASGRKMPTTDTRSPGFTESTRSSSSMISTATQQQPHQSMDCSSDSSINGCQRWPASASARTGLAGPGRLPT